MNDIYMNLKSNFFIKILVLATMMSYPFMDMSAQSTGTVSGIVRDVTDGSILTGANVSVVGQTRGSTANLEGMYMLTLEAGTYQLRVTFIGYTPIRETITVVSGQNVNLDFNLRPDLIGVDDIIVLGTRTTDRTVIESSVPIDVISAL